MATWITHLRIAENFIKEGLVPDNYITEFIEGSVAPDCGYGQKDSFSGFNPPPSVTHFSPDGTKVFCDYKGFYDAYLNNRTRDAAYYFYLGYYIHLICDALWSTVIFLPATLKYKTKSDEFVNTLKKDWYDIDFKYLKENPDFTPYKVLCGVDTIPQYLPYYDENQLTVQIKCIADYYKDSTEHATDRVYTYLTPDEITEFVALATDLIKYKL